MNAVLTEKRNQVEKVDAELRALIDNPEAKVEDIETRTATLTALNEDITKLVKAEEALNDAQTRSQSLGTITPGAAVAVRGQADVGTVDIENTPQGLFVREGREDFFIPENMSTLVENDYKRAFHDYLRGSDRRMDKRSLQAGIDPQGGVLIPPDYVQQLIRRKPAPTRLGGRVRTLTTSRDSIMLPRVTGGDDLTYPTNVRITWTGETNDAAGYTGSNTEAQFGLSTIGVHEFLITGQISRTLMEDSAFDIMSWVSETVSDAYELERERVISIGSGVGQPRGFFAQLTTVNSTGSGAISADDVRLLPFEVSEQYVDGAVFVMNRKSSGKAVAKLKDSQNRYLFGRGYQDSGLKNPVEIDTLDGYPVVYCVFAPDVASAAVPVAFGNLQSYYMVNRIAMTIQMLYETAAKNGMVEFVVRGRFGGDFMESWGMRGLLIQ